GVLSPPRGRPPPPGPAWARGGGRPAPDFVLETADGGDRVRLQDLVGEKPVVVQLGSHSCPVYRYRRHTMDNLWEDYADRVHFVVVYTTEAHPVGSKSPYSDGEWDPMINKLTDVRVTEPASLEERRDVAASSKAELGLPVPVLIDTMDNAVWSAYGEAASPAFVIDRRGDIALSQPWVHPREIRATLERLLAE
ncbi:MAG: deiodinase-like protein, partial [Acidobacteriota bacterium]